jgi:hypothetical protein
VKERPRNSAAAAKVRPKDKSNQEETVTKHQSAVSHESRKQRSSEM